MNRQTGQMTWLCPTRLFDGRTLHEGHAAGISSGTCVAVLPAAELPDGATRIDIAGTLSPGFVDLQVNGGGGRLVNAEPTADCMRHIAATHAGFGTAAILPTVITDSPDILARATDAAIAARGSAGVAGLHIEGPHISVARRGTHLARHIRPLTADTIDLVRRLRAYDVKVLITLAPEAADAAGIAQLAELGAVVSLGHTDADAEQARAGFAAGAAAVTHLFNAMSPMQNREPGVTGAAINSEVRAGVICDGIHVADEMIGLAFRARPIPDRMFLVSDAMPTVGGPDRFRLYGQEIRLDGRRLSNAEGSLAGAHTTMAEGVHRLIADVGIGPQAALRAAISVPSDLMGLDLDRMVGRALSDLVVLDDAYRYRRQATALLAN